MNGNSNKKGFLKRLNEHLLIHRPVVWSSRIHNVLCYGLSFTLVISMIAFGTSNEPRANTAVYNWVVLLSVISVLSLICWMIYLLRFNVFKRYGKWGQFDSLKTFVFYFLAIALFVSWPFVPLVFQSVRANMAYTSEELVKDINDMNVKLCLLERDSIDLTFKRDTLELSKYVDGSRQKVSRNESIDYTEYSDYFHYVDSLTLEQRLSSSDSTSKINDTTYVVYDCPDYQFVSTYNFPAEVRDGIMTSMALFNIALKSKPSINKENTRSELVSLLKKYTIKSHVFDSSELAGYDVIDYTVNSFWGRLNRLYGLNEVNSSLSSITEKKYRWDSRFIATAIRIVYYISLFMALLVFIYRHTTRKAFFLSLLAGVIIFILTVLLITVDSYNNQYWGGWYLFYFAVFTFLSGMIFFGRKRDPFLGIALNLAVFMVVLVPLIAVSLRYSYLHELYYKDTDSINYYRLFRNEDLHYLLAEISGLVLLLLLIATFIQKAYRKWYALPEQ